MPLEDIVIVGAGGLGREVLFQLNEINKQKARFNLLGFVDDAGEKGSLIHGLPVLGDTDWLSKYEKHISAAVCVGSSAARRSIYERFSKNDNIHFPNIFADDFRGSDSVKFGIGCIICFSCIATVDITIGDFALISNDCTIGHDSVLGDFVTLYPSVNISGNVKVCDNTEIGASCNIIQGKTVGSGSIIGAGAVVVGDIPDNCTAVGVPARVIRRSSKQ
ncbi:MAG: acetyltransferase [Clostridiales bacterium]|nr:acetyltransferase [Clostridiales bacterium]